MMTKERLHQLVETLPEGEVATAEQLLERVYLTCYSRLPKPEERKRVLAALQDLPATGTARRDAIEDLLAAMLTTKEFLFNH